MAAPTEALNEPPTSDLSTFWRLPEGELPHEETIRCLRALGGSGEVTGKELLDLGYFLNEHEDACTSWPGDQLLAILAEMFDGRIPSLADREEVHTDLELIEREYVRVVAPERDDKPALPLDSIRTELLKLPKIDRSVVIECVEIGKEVTVDLWHQSCNCPNWNDYRARLKTGDVRRCCVHMVEAYHLAIEEGNVPDCQPAFQELMADRARRGRSIDAHAEWKLVKIRMRPHIVIYGHRAWNYVYAPDEGASYSRFAYHSDEQRWSFGRARSNAKTIELFIAEAGAGHVS